MVGLRFGIAALVLAGVCAVTVVYEIHQSNTAIVVNEAKPRADDDAFIKNYVASPRVPTSGYKQW